jgi:pimeloyl-ACP methyl ester carboxylesterase
MSTPTSSSAQPIEPAQKGITIDSWPMPDSLQVRTYRSLRQTVTAGFLSGPALEIFSISVTNHNGLERKFEFGFRAGKENRPLIFMIPGFGCPLDERATLYLGNVLQKEGFHIASLHSPSNPKFLVDSHHSGIPGVTTEDARDLLLGIRAVAAHLRKQGQRFEGIHLLGFSMGALNAAFVHKLDRESDSILQKTIMVNPPVDMRFGMNGLDLLLESLNITLWEKIKIFSKAIPSIILPKLFNFGTAPIRWFLSKALFSERELRAIIGSSFQETIVNGILAARKSGALHATTQVKNFTDFCDSATLAHYRKWNPTGTSNDFFQSESLLNIGAEISRNKNVFVLHNEDDFILGPEDVVWLKTKFGSRAILFKEGGHLGNIWREDFQSALLQILEEVH